MNHLMKLSQHASLVLVVAAGVALSACQAAPTADNGSCALDQAAVVDCSITRTDLRIVSAEDAGVVAQLCTGSARPDGNPNYVDGVPIGQVCSDKGQFGEQRGYCCTQQPTGCAYNPVAECEPGHDGFQCRGTRPDFVNPTLYCREGLQQGTYIDYCCINEKQVTPPNVPRPNPCTWKDPNEATCAAGLANWVCPVGKLPVSEELPRNQSRSDLYSLICATPTKMGDGSNGYCCYTPPLPRPGASCSTKNDVPNCGAKRFGFACYGPDSPSDSFLPMRCSEPGFPGMSAAGYPATLYCCDYDLALAKSSLAGN